MTKPKEPVKPKPILISTPVGVSVPDAIKAGTAEIVRIPPTICGSCGNPKREACGACGN